MFVVKIKEGRVGALGSMGRGSERLKRRIWTATRPQGPVDCLVTFMGGVGVGQGPDDGFVPRYGWVGAGSIPSPKSGRSGGGKLQLQPPESYQEIEETASKGS